MKPRIAIVASHPIQYQAHWFRELTRSAELDVEVLYCHDAMPEDQARAGFGVAFEWDVPLLEGYRHRFLRNAARKHGVSDFSGTDSPELRGIIIHERYDAVMVSGWHTKSYLQAIAACRESATPVMVRGDSHLHDDRSGVRQAVKWLPYRYFISRMDACLAAGIWSRDYFIHYGARPERVFIVPHCVAQKAPRSDAETQIARTESRMRWQVREPATVFLFAGKFISRKRPFDFIHALAAASAAGTPVHGLMAGDGPMRSEMEALATSLSAPITFTGFLNQSAMVDAYVASDILVLPSEQDTWGLVVNEAMTNGRACIVSDRVGCGPDLILAGQTGFVFPLGDAGALADCMRRISETNGMASRMGAAAKALIAGHSARAAVEGLLAAVAAIMDNR